MVGQGQGGQSTTELLLMMSLLTILGVSLLVKLTGSDKGGKGGAIIAMSTEASKRIAADERP